MMPRARRALPAALSALTLVVAPLSAQSRGVTATDSVRIDSIFAAYNRPDAPGCAVGVATDGAMRFGRGYGLASLEHGIAIDTRTPFNIGSIGKQFTAMAVLLLEQRGALSLDDPVSRYVDGLPTDGAPLRVRDLLYHTSGIRDQGALGMLAGAFPHTMPQFRAMMRRQQGLNFPTGTLHDYSHSDYTLLADVVERASGIRFAQYLDEEIFSPLGMTSTMVWDERRQPIAGLAFGYARDSSGVRARYPNSELIGGSNVFTSVEDLLRWEANAYTARVGGRALVDRLHAPAPLSLPFVMPYSHGLWHANYRGERLQHRSGGADGYSTTYLRFPDARLAVIALCNVANAFPFPQAQAVADGFLAGRLAPEAMVEESSPLPADEVQRLTGRYASKRLPWDPIQIVSHGGHLYERFGDDSARLHRVRDGHYAYEGFSYTFTPAGGGRPARLLMQSDGTREEAERLPDQAQWLPSRANLAAVSGRWLSEELVVAWSTIVRSDTLLLRRPGTADVHLEPFGRDRFRAPVRNGAGFPTWIGIAFARDARGRVTHFTAGTIPAEFEAALGVRFDRMP